MLNDGHCPASDDIAALKGNGRPPGVDAGIKDDMESTAKLSKACIPCRRGKTKCDAPTRGLPCSQCVRKESQPGCILPTRKRRVKVPRRLSPPEIRPAAVLGADAITPAQTPENSHPPASIPSQQRAAACYPDVVSQAGGASKANNFQFGRLLKDLNKSHDDANSSSQATHQLDPLDEEYLARKGVFALPPQTCIVKIVRTYFECIDPFSPVINRAAFVRSFNSGNCSLFLLYSILAAGMMHVPPMVAVECGFGNRTQAVATFRTKATLLYDFEHETDPTCLLQGSFILGVVANSSQTNKDFRYWFYNAVRLLTNNNTECCNIGTDRGEGGGWNFSKLYKRIWWSLYCREVLLSFLGSHRMKLLGQNEGAVGVLTASDWDAQEDDVENSELLVLPFANRQKLQFIWYCSLVTTGSKCLTAVSTVGGQNPESIIDLLDAWRSSVRHALQIDDQSLREDISWFFLLASSYRFEAVLLRLLRAQLQVGSKQQSDWAKQRLRSAMLELDTITAKVLANNALLKLPYSFATCIPILLALHIEAAMDTTEPDVVRSMSRISIRQAMLMLKELSDIPSMRLLRLVFEKILTQNNLEFDRLDTEPLDDGSDALDSVAVTGYDTGEPPTWASELNELAWPGFSELFFSFDDFPLQDVS